MINERLEELLNEFSLGSISEEETNELEQLLENPVNRAAMVDFFHEETALRDILQEEKSRLKSKKIKTNKNKIKTVRKKLKKKKSPLPFIMTAIAAIMAIGFLLLTNNTVVTSEGLFVSKVIGSSTYSVNDSLAEGTEIRTSEEQVHLQFADGTIAIVPENTSLKIESFLESKKIKLDKGRVLLDVEKQEPGKPLFVYSDKAEATVRGTKLEFSTEQKQSRLDVYEGKVEFNKPGSSTSVMVNAGEYSRTSKGELKVEDRAGDKNDFIAYWDFDNDFSDKLKDVSGNVRYSKINGAQRVSGYQRSGMNFDGKDDYIDVGDIRLAKNQVTVSAWVNVKNLRGIHEEGRIISKANEIYGEGHFFMLSIYPSDKGHGIRFRLRTNDKTATLTSPPTKIHLGEWMHLVGTYDGRRMRVYKNGELLSFMNKRGEIDAGEAVKTWIGGNPTGATDRPFAGKIDEVKIYKKALSEKEVKELFLGTRD